MKLFKKILVANRGEIAIRVMRTAKEMGIRTVAIYSEVDADSFHVKVADESYCIGIESLAETYLNIEKIIKIALKAGCEAIHPGYGFLAENPEFVNACESSGIIFIGPSGKVIALMGNKIEARSFIRSINIPLIEGAVGKDTESLIKAGKKISFPLLLKAAAGGGGKGMRIVRDEKQLREGLESTAREAEKYFGDGTVYIEKYLDESRHIEFQVLGDNFGNAIHVFERECSIQRRYQKIIEESPSVTLSPKIREKMGETAVKICKKTGYNNAGTIEFLVDKNLNFFFLEMNTRIQVEHPVTELTTGLDLVKEQILISAGNPLRYKQKDIAQKGHAIEARIYAEDPSNSFLPSPGKMTFYKEPAGKNTRVDTAVKEAAEIKSLYDPMISKLIVYGNNRNEAIGKLESALSEYVIHGIQTNIEFLIGVLQHEKYRNNQISTLFCSEKSSAIIDSIKRKKHKLALFVPVLVFAAYILHKKKSDHFSFDMEKQFIWNYIGYWRNIIKIPVQVNGEEKEVNVYYNKNGEFITELEEREYLVKSNRISNGEIDIYINNKPVHAFISKKSIFHYYITYQGNIFEIIRRDYLQDDMDTRSFEEDFGDGSGVLISPMPGKVIKINTKKGAKISKGAVVMIIEAMKMENNIIAGKDGVISKINVTSGQMVEGGASLGLIE
ncbi:MAG: acetyl-CoA carboxylase biotin carboxylase subunit [Bacteroidales bacterium]|nr:acetyl-CoA carboxylase biotin carboxylase subunit [Bacteroidales bacterium]